MAAATRLGTEVSRLGRTARDAHTVKRGVKKTYSTGRVDIFFEISHLLPNPFDPER